MSKIDPQIVLTRLNKIDDYLQRLDKYKTLTLQEYLDNEDIQLITERIIQIITEAALDINKYILSRLGILQQRDDWTNKDYFLEAGNQKIITQDLANELSAAAGMRNVLVHLYLDIDPDQVFTAIAKSLKYYPLYMRQIITYLDKEEINHE